MSEALTRILDYACVFSEKIDRCRTTPVNATDWEDAYNRLNRFRERYLREKSYLVPLKLRRFVRSLRRRPSSKRCSTSDK
jgi:hypothetical protein